MHSLIFAIRSSFEELKCCLSERFNFINGTYSIAVKLSGCVRNKPMLRYATTLAKWEMAERGIGLVELDSVGAISHRQVMLVVLHMKDP